MQEDFLYYIWKHKAFNFLELKTTSGEAIVIKQLGQHNHNAGPDFFNANLIIDEQLWAGNVEMHINASDWYVHHHEKDKAYDNVILHVVWEHDVDIFRKDDSTIPTLELKYYVDENLLQNYQKLVHSKSWINCENSFSEITDFTINNWLERLYIERLERKASEIEVLLKQSNNDWEAVLFKMLLKSFGLKINGEAFFSLAKSFEFSIVRKLQNECLDLEALLFGQAGLLTEDNASNYHKNLQIRYQFIKHKFDLDSVGVLPVQFFRLRPPNFPTIRLSQLANLYHQQTGLFSKVIQTKTKDDIYKLFNVAVSLFWQSHYTFKTTSKTSKKQLSKAFVDLLTINTFIPLKFAYAKTSAKSNEDEIFEFIKSLKLEKNSLVDSFLKLKPLDKNALTSQSLIQLKTEYCDKNKCLQCAIGNSIISS